MNDGEKVKFGDIAFYVSGSSQSILKAERLVLNAMQRMSAIATKTAFFVDLLDNGTGIMNSSNNLDSKRFFDAKVKNRRLSNHQHLHGMTLSL